ncbi:5'/3'-nucleotidase SurE [Treponema sp. J25]|uniref:5'/3'-nucleotidase SurE n=1 Tax=Treponema sp. J25 TaxID=2094121 RepID=UPI00105325C8|nr:5'/3'-nucleotidase SurE [Treponema sp. J25]TCW61559.1 5'/3'-nucleotidase SurE [Treponema sp. J25]
MNILLTNDDGISCQGIWALKSALEAGTSHKIYVIVPEDNRSGISHGITMRGPIRVRYREERVWTCSGTPADCVIVGLLGEHLPVRPDLILSGINEGPNLGTDIIYSGTAAAARQGALHGIPSFALSMGTYDSFFYYDVAARYIAENLEKFLPLWGKDTFININFPNTASLQADFRITYPSRRSYKDTLVRFVGPDGHHYCFIDGGEVSTHPEEGSDADAVERGYVSISRVYIHPLSVEQVKTT